MALLLHASSIGQSAESMTHNNLAVNSSAAQGELYVAVYMQYRSLLEPDFIVEFLGTVE